MPQQSEYIAGYSLPWWTVEGGGGDSNGGNYALSGTIGQPEAAAPSGALSSETTAWKAASAEG